MSRMGEDIPSMNMLHLLMKTFHGAPWFQDSVSGEFKFRGSGARKS